MIRIALVLCVLWPLSAAAEWAPRPSMFSYEATFALCTSDPAAPPQTEDCADLLAAAYALKRAVLKAAYDCADLPLSECPAPLEDQGLPAIAARIASDIGCDPTSVTALPEDEPLPLDHCANVTADIMIDEGVVPVLTDIECTEPAAECRELAMIHATLWIDAADVVAEGDPTIDDLQARNVNDCLASVTTTGVQAELDAMSCMASRAAALWSDLALQD